MESASPKTTVTQGGPSKLKGRRWTNERLRVLLHAVSLSLDCFAVAVGYAVVSTIRIVDWTALPVPVLLITLSLFVMFSVGREVQSTETLADTQEGVYRSLGALALTMLAEILLLFLTQAGGDVSRLGFMGFFAIAAFFLVVSHLLQGALNRVVLGEIVVATALLIDGRDVEAPPGMTVIDLTPRGLWPDLGKPAAMAELSSEIEGFDRLVVACTDDHYQAWAIFLQGAGAPSEIMAGSDNFRGAIGIGRCGPEDTLIISRGTLSLANRAIKRLFDVTVGGLMLLMLAPLMIAIAIAIRVDSPGPVLFRQRRIGLSNRQFEIFKFRSMHTDLSDLVGAASTARRDPRLTRVGVHIRRTSIDELPQLINVILGDMSLVGPRPHALGSMAGERLFWDVDERYWVRHSLRPGITGLAQIRGFRGSTDSTSDLENRLQCDLEYLSRWNLRLDLRILLATVRVIVHDKAY